jgi:hypothetical protein
MEISLASFLVFLGLIVFMFGAGHEWHRLQSRDRHQESIDSLTRKL